MIRNIFGFFSDIVNLRNDDIILAAHPKTGSTWIRFLFCNLGFLKEGKEVLVDFDILNETMVSIGGGKLKYEWELPMPRIIVTHLRYLPFFRKNKIILMLRDPRDVMISYYHYLKAKKEPVYHFKDARKKDYDETFTNFIQHPKCGFPSFFDHYSSWRGKEDVIIQYEAMKKSPVEEFKRILMCLGISAEDDIIREAVRRSDIKNVRKYDDKKGHKDFADTSQNGAKFTRNGSTEQWKTVFDAEQLKIYHDYREKFCDSFPY